jgi:hypothetical protein
VPIGGGIVLEPVVRRAVACGRLIAERPSCLASPPLQDRTALTDASLAKPTTPVLIAVEKNSRDHETGERRRSGASLTGLHLFAPDAEGLCATFARAASIAIGGICSGGNPWSPRSSSAAPPTSGTARFFELLNRFGNAKKSLTAIVQPESA